MKDETQIWLNYAKENFDSAKILVKKSLYNTSLQNIQQAIEKSLKALLVENNIKIVKTHNITNLRSTLIDHGIHIEITPDECELLDSIYLPSKYPIGNIIPDFEANIDICREGIEIADRVINHALSLMDK